MIEQKKGEKKPRGNWFIQRIKNNQLITFTFVFLALNNLFWILSNYFVGEDLFPGKPNTNTWALATGITVAYFFLWLLAVVLSAKFTEETLKQRILKHPITTIIILFFYITDLPYRFAAYGTDMVSIFETGLFYAYIYFRFKIT